MKINRLIFQIPEELHNKYKIACEKNSFTLSKRMRNFIELDLELMSKGKNILNEINLKKDGK